MKQALFQKKYDEWHEKVCGVNKPSTMNLSQWHENALALSPPLKGLKVLEVGCGTGNFSIFVSEAGARVTAVDFSKKAIEFAIQRAHRFGRSIDFQVADAQKLPFESNSFDLIFSCECLEHVLNPQQMLNECYRVLTPSGRLILTTPNYSNGGILAWVYSWLKREPINTGAGVQPHENLFFFWTVQKMIRRAGFRIERMIGSHHVFLLLPRFDPSTFTKSRFKNPFLAKHLLPFALHIAYEAVKN